MPNSSPQDCLASGIVVVPPDAEKLKVIRELVAGVTGLNAERGDQLVIDTLPFESTLTLEPPQAAPPVAAPPAPPASPWTTFSKMDKKMRMIVIGAGAALVLLLVGGVLMLVRRSGKKKPVAVTGPAALPSATALRAPASASSSSPACRCARPAPPTCCASLPSDRTKTPICERVREASRPA